MIADGALGRCGRYELVERIGAGGMGEIFLARARDGERVAIKRLLPACAQDPVFAGMFLDEARLLEKLRHPNVCSVLEHGNDAGRYYLVMEHVDGPSLAELLAKRGKTGLSCGLACRVVAEVAAALDYAHRLTDEAGAPLGVVHRDVSPGNILIARDGRVKLVDFGLAKARTQLVRTRPGLVKGKLGYLAPEQLRGSVDHRADIFALGLCFYEALLGVSYFGQRSAAATVAAIREHSGAPDVASFIRGAPPALDAVLARALAPKPEDRFESAAAFRAALGRLVIESGAGAITADDLAAEVARSMRAKPSSMPPPRLSVPELASEPPGKASPSRSRLLLFAALTLAMSLALVLWLLLR